MRLRTRSTVIWAIVLWGIVPLLLLAGVGCTPRVIVHANPSQHDKGIRYYRPKPYLKIEPAEVSKADQQIETLRMVKISLVYLPDFSEEYSIDVRSGFGTADVGIKLDDGWNLTEISQDLDSQTDENLEAIGSIISAVGDVIPTAANTGEEEIAFTVPALNVPIGFYESVVGRDSAGCKRLYGFRYLGFLPYSQCPIDMGGNQRACCNNPATGLYGLVFTQGQMVFQSLDSIASSPVSRTHDASAVPSQANTSLRSSPSESSEALPTPAVEKTPIAVGPLDVGLRRYLRLSYPEVQTVDLIEQPAGVTVSIGVDSQVPAEALRQLAEQWIIEALPDNDWTRVKINVVQFEG
jgi:hypothetical protein